MITLDSQSSAGGRDTSERSRLPDPRVDLRGHALPARIHDAFLARVAEAPTRRAIASLYGDCSYRELEVISRRLAGLLRGRGACAGVTVAIYSDRSPALIYALLGVLRSGSAFHILDPAYPSSRIAACLSQSRPALLIIASHLTVSSELDADFPTSELPRISLSARVDEALAMLDRQTFDPRLPDVPADALAYVSFTSGSTGTPKGIVTRHAPLPHFIRWHVEHGALTRDDRFSLLSGLSHDPLLRDVFTPLSIGASLHVPEQRTIFDAEALWSWFEREQISVVHMTPAIGEILATGAPEGARLRALRRVYWGGDVLSLRLHARLNELAPAVAQTNFYGATETPQAMAYFDLARLGASEVIPLGRGIDGAQLLIVNDRGELCGTGESGEIWVRSPYLSDGYLNDREQTERRFVVNSFRDDPLDRCYRTGDLGVYREDGEVLFRGRADHQVKIRGFRVEPAEIERALERQSEVSRAMVIAREERGEKQLVAYVVTPPSAANAAAPLRDALERELPSYMVPKHIVPVAALPLLPNGKVDIQSLPPPAPEPTLRAGKRPPRTEAQRQLAALWAEILGLEEVSIDESFVELGGDSLSAIRALSRMRRLGVPEEVARGIFQGRTIAELTGEQPSTSDRPLIGNARTTQLINVLRGLIVLLLVVDHWREGIFKRLSIPMEITNAIEFIFHLPTPGFAFVFGIGLGYTHYENYRKNPAASRKLLQGGALILALGTLIMGLSRNLGVLARGTPLDYHLFSTNFFLPTLYYWLALATAPAWFWFIRRRETKWGGTLLAALLLAFACRGSYELSRFLLLEHEQRGLLQLGRLMLTARFSYFNLSTGALLGVFFGLYLRRERERPRLFNQLASFGAATLTLGVALYWVQRDRYPEGLLSADIWLPEWLFYLGITLLLGALVDLSMLTYRYRPARALLAWTGIVGQCAMPIFILQGMVFDVTAFGRALGLSDALSVAVAMFGFLASVGWMMRRIHGLYYGRLSARGEELVPVRLS